MCAAAVLAASLGGCQFFGKPDVEGARLAALQVWLQRFADEFVSGTAATLDEYALVAGTDGVRSQVLRWKVDIGSTAIHVASGPNPTANLIDTLVLAALTRMVFEIHAPTAADPEAFEAVLVASRGLEVEAWKLGQRVLDPPTRQRLRDTVEQWRETNPAMVESLVTRPQEVTAFIVQIAETAAHGDGTSFDGLLGLDPLVGLDPALREFTQSRLAAERTLFTVQRMPVLLQWQIELLADELLRRKEVGAMTASADRIARAAESIGDAAAALPDRIATEREAILAAFDAREGRLGELTKQVQLAFEAGQRMSDSLERTAGSLEALVTSARAAPADPRAEPARPFDIREYANAADRIAVTAKELAVVVHESRLALDAFRLDESIDEAKSIVDRAFLLGAGLVVFAFACALGYRRLTRTKSP